MSFSAQKKLQIVLAGLNDDTSITELCKEHGISRQTFYDWKQALEDGALKSLESSEPGRKSKEHISSLQEAGKKINELKNEKQQLEDKLEQAQKQEAIKEIQRDYIKFCLTEDEIDPEIKKKNKELLKKKGFSSKKTMDSK